MNTFQKHETTINTICNILRTAIAAAALIVAIAALKAKSEPKSQPELPVPNNIDNYEKDENAELQSDNDENALTNQQKPE